MSISLTLVISFLELRYSRISSSSVPSPAISPAKISVAKISSFGSRLKFSYIKSAITQQKTMKPTAKNVIMFCFILPNRVFMARLMLRLNEVLSRGI